MRDMGLEHNMNFLFNVFEVSMPGKTLFCCLSGGEMREDGECYFTTLGQAALNTLAAIPRGSHDLIIRELKAGGKRSISQKISETLDYAEDGMKICFFGDMAGDLDGEIMPVFNLQKEYLVIPADEPLWGEG